jgi:hypothetical protein
MGEHRSALSFHQPSMLSQPTVCLDVITDQSGHSKAGAVEKAHVDALCRMYHVIVVSCDSFRSPNSSACKSCWIFRRLERDTRSVSVALSTSNGFVEGGVRIMSRNSVAALGDKAATT